MDDFINARAERDISSAEWIAALPPASVNDNFAAPVVDAFEESPQADLLADIATALSEPEMAAPSVPHAVLYDLRAELIAMRDALRYHLQAA